jgi:hypothetical protein
MCLMVFRFFLGLITKMFEEKYVFIDEYGNTNLNTALSNVGTHYIITAIIINKSDLESVEVGFEEIRSDEFQSGEMKSSKVGNKDRRRIRILEKLAEFPFRIYCLPVNKRELTSEGYKYQDSFFKNLNAKLYRIIFRDFPIIKAFVDEYKTTDFMLGFKKYLINKFPSDLFTKMDIDFVDSKKNVIVQGADFIAGSIARYFDKTLKSSDPIEFLKIMDNKKRIYWLEEFPLSIEPYVISVEREKSSKFDQHIEEYTLRNARKFVYENDNSKNENTQNQVLCVRVLLQHHYFHPNDFLYGDKLLEDINEIRLPKLTQHQFHSNIIAGLRDKNIIISSSHNGYKLPASLKDIYSFLDLVNKMVVPLLKRVDSCRKALLRTTDFKLDILKEDCYEVLHKALKEER